MAERRAAPLALALLVMLGCSGRDSGSSVTSPAQTVAAIALASSTLSLAVHQQAQIDAQFRDAEGREMSNVLGATWTSGDPSIVTVTSSGSLTALKVGGPVAVTVAAGTATATATARVTVSATLGLVGAPSVLRVDSSATVSAAFVDFFGATLSPVTATWSSSDPTVVTVDATSGRLVGIRVGTATITGVANGTLLSFAVEVGVDSPLDGTWTGSIPVRGDVTVVVLFGVMHTFSLYFHALPVIGGGACTVNLSSTTPTPVVNSQFSASIPYDGHANGVFSSSTALTVTVSGLLIPNSAYVCSAGSSVPGAAPPPGTYVVTMTR